MFEELMKEYAEVNTDEATMEAYDAVVAKIYANGFSESEVFDYCVSEGLLEG